MLSVKVAEDPESALLALWPRLQALAVEPVRGEEDLVDRTAFQGVAFEAQYRVRLGGRKPDEVVPGWGEHFLALVRENSRASNEREKSSTVLYRLEQKRALYAAAASPSPLPPATAPVTDMRPPATSTASVDHYTRRTMSEVLTEFLDAREQQEGDRRADSDIEPVVRFLIELLGDPVMLDFNGEHLLKVKKALPAIPTTRGFSPSERSLYFRWQWAAENGWTREKDGKTIKLKRVSETTLKGRYETSAAVALRSSAHISNAVMAMSAFRVSSSIGIRAKATPIAAHGPPSSAAAKSSPPCSTSICLSVISRCWRSASPNASDGSVRHHASG